jgi:predicted  nucleic acid-binding Zn-ribbon protein
VSDGDLARLSARVNALEKGQHELREAHREQRLALKELRQLVVKELRALAEQLRDTGRAVDTMLAELELRDAQERFADGG